MKYLLLILFFAIVSSIHAQDTFQKRYWSIYAYPIAVTMTSDSSILIIANDSINKRIFYIIKTDKNGVFQWIKTDSSSRADNYFTHDDFASFLFVPTYDGNFIIGSARHDTANALFQTTSLAKIDTAGNVLWNRTYSKPYRLHSICQTNDSGFIIMGQVPDTVVSSLHYSNGITKIDSAGNILWTKVFQYGDMEIIQTDDGGYLREGNNTISKLDGDGNYLRAFEITNPRNAYGRKERKAIRLNSNAYVFANHGFLTCYDSTGNLLWDRVISLGWWLTNRSIIDIARLNDSTIVLLGDVLGVWPDAYIQKIDLDGNLIQHTVYELNEKVTPYALFPFSDGRLIIACTDDYYQTQENVLLLLKTDSAGNTGCGDAPSTNQDSLRIDTLIPVVQNFISGSNTFITDSIVSYTSYISNEDTICYQITAATELSGKDFEFSISPNPTTRTFAIKNLPSHVTSMVQIINLFGEIVYSEKLSGMNEYVFDVSLAKGIYFVRVKDAVRKLIIE